MILDIIDYYSLIRNHTKALKYVEAIQEAGLKIKYHYCNLLNRFRDYESICKNIADDGSISEFESLLIHMNDHGIERSEIVFYYELKTCIVLI